MDFIHERGIMGPHEFMNLTDASEAERDIIYKILYKDPDATLAQKQLFASLHPHNVDEVPPVPKFNFEKNQGLPQTSESVMTGNFGGIPIPTHTVTSFGIIPTNIIPGQNGHPVVTQSQASMLLMEHQNVGQGPPQLREVYTGNQMFHVPPNLVFQQYGQGPYLTHLNQHQIPHMNQQYAMGLQHVAYPSNIHPQGQQGFSNEDMSHIQKSHEIHPINSSPGGQGTKEGYRKSQRPRRPDEPPPPISHISGIPYMSGMPYGPTVYYNPNMAATVSNVTGQPIIIPNSAQQPGGLYPPYQNPHMYSGGAELEHTGPLIMQHDQISPQIQTESGPPSHVTVPTTHSESLKPVQEHIPVSSAPSVNGPTLDKSPSFTTNEVEEKKKDDQTSPQSAKGSPQASSRQNATVSSPVSDTKSQSTEDRPSKVPASQSITSQAHGVKSNHKNVMKFAGEDNSQREQVVNGPPSSSSLKMEEMPHLSNGPPQKKERENPEFPHLSLESNIGSVKVTNGPKSVPPSAGRSWASIASSKSKLANGPPTNGVIESSNTNTGITLSSSSEGATSNSEVPTVSPIHTEYSVSSHPHGDSASFDPALLSNENDPIALRLGEFLAAYQLNHHSISLTPRGLVNQSNFCYINATLQSLLACPPFVNLFRHMEDIIGRKPCKATPILQSVFDFVMDFEPITRFNQNNKNKRPQDAFYVGPHLDPTGIRRVLTLLEGATFKVEGRQEDAEEFLSHLLNGLHDEMTKVIRWYENKKEQQLNPKSIQQVSPPIQPPAVNGDASGGGGGEDEDDEWQVMGPKNKGSMTRKTDLSKSPVSEMFVGQMSSLLNRGNTPKTTTLQPFFTLQLDIQDENIHSVRDALDGLTTKEEVSGTSSNNSQEAPMWKQLTLECLPIILVIHLKRFVYDKSCNKIFKLDKRVDFGVDLEIMKELLSINCKSKSSFQKQRAYKLFAAVYHDGEEAHKGHYVADTFHPSGGSLWGQFGWIRYDDTQVKGVLENQILNPQPPRVPYLLYYRRMDTLTPGKKLQKQHNMEPRQ